MCCAGGNHSSLLRHKLDFARQCLDMLVKREPGNAYAWAALAAVALNQAYWGFGLPQDQAADL